MPSAPKSATGISLALAAQLALATAGAMAAEPVTLDAVEFGLRGDGRTDDGPALQKMVAEARALAGPKRMVFPAGARILVASGTERYALRLDEVEDLVVEGRGATFLIDPELRFLHATRCRELELRDFNVTVAREVAVDGTVTGQSAPGRQLAVRLDNPEQHELLGGPTREDGEQDFFGMLQNEEDGIRDSHHYYVEGATTREDGTVVIAGRDPLPARWRQRLAGGLVRISLPVPGIAHRFGPGPMVRIDRCENVRFSQVEIWSAPWFAFEILRNRGEVEFRAVHIRPQPGTGAATSSWRDGFHVKGNSGRLLFEDCIIEGTHDDAFNVSTHGWKVTEVLAPDRVRLRQVFPIQYMPMQEGGNLLILSADGTRRLLPANIVALAAEAAEDVFDPREHKAPEVTLTLDRPVAGLAVGCLVWDLSTANPSTVIRRCTMGNSCRFQSPVTLEDCRSEALLYFYGDKLEGPLPSGSTIRNSTMNKGRGNNTLAVAIKGWRDKAPSPLPPAAEFPLQNIRITGCTIRGDVSVDGLHGLDLDDNTFREGRAIIVNPPPAGPGGAGN
jgi:hypothetical protein